MTTTLTNALAALQSSMLQANPNNQQAAQQQYNTFANAILSSSNLESTLNTSFQDGYLTQFLYPANTENNGTTYNANSGAYSADQLIVGSQFLNSLEGSSTDPNLVSANIVTFLAHENQHAINDFNTTAPTDIDGVDVERHLVD